MYKYSIERNKLLPCYRYTIGLKKVHPDFREEIWRMNEYMDILVAVDGSSEAKLALYKSIEMVKLEENARLHHRYLFN